MKVQDPRIRSLLRQAKRTADAGKRAAAQQLYAQITEEAPEVIEGWLGLAETALDSDEREAAYRQVLQLEPGNTVARRALDGTAPPLEAPPATTPRAALESPAEPSTVDEGSAPAESEHSPFDQSRAWLQEATQRQQPVPEEVEPEPETARPAPSVEPRPPLEVTLPPTGEAAQAAGETALVCYRHPGRETGLRCYSCERPICIKCAKRTPVGYRCPECIREAEGVFYTANVVDYLLAGVVTLILGLIAGYIVNFVGFFVIFIGPAAGSLIGRLAFRVARRHHGRWLPHLVAGMVALGGLLPRVLPLFLGLLMGQVSLAGLGFGLIWPLIYVFLATGAAYYQVK
jgi:hypothetical protein